MSEAKMAVAKQPSTPTKKRSRKPPKPFSPNDMYSNVSAKVQVSTAGKSCSQCGATKTPQWREGPLGPKTLCNACGVKRVRAARAAMEGRMRMAKASKTSKASVEEVSTTRRRAKGKSKAARAAAFILAAIEEQQQERPSAMAVDEATTSQSDDCSAEEIQFIPPKPPMSPISAVIGEGGIAALGLMSMSLPAEVVQKSINAQLEAHRAKSAAKAPQETAGETNNAAVVETKKEQSLQVQQQEMGKATTSGFQKLNGSGTADTLTQASQGNAARNGKQMSSPERRQRIQLEDLQNQAAEAAKHAYAADAAVAAVAQVLAIKQAVALKARAEASAAAQRVHAVQIAMCKEENPLVPAPPTMQKPNVV